MQKHRPKRRQRRAQQVHLVRRRPERDVVDHKVSGHREQRVARRVRGRKVTRSRCHFARVAASDGWIQSPDVDRQHKHKHDPAREPVQTAVRQPLALVPGIDSVAEVLQRKGKKKMNLLFG